MEDDVSEEDRLFDEAVDLLIRIQSDPENPVALDVARRWLSRGPAQEKAWSEALEIHGMTGKILTDRRRADRKAAFSVSRRVLMVGSFVGAAGLVAAASSGPRLILQARADAMTATGEIRRLELPDGSFATLGPNSAIALTVTAQRREIELLQGMAFFEVAPDETRPFRVTSAGVTATALGTAFDVSSDADCLTIAVDHGLVGVDLPPDNAIAPARLAQGEWLTFAEGDQSVSIGKKDRSQIASWRHGMVVVERETVAAVVARIARWKKGEVVITSPSFGRRLVSGVYDLRDPALALEAVVQPHGGRVRSVTPYLTVISPF